MYAVLHTTCTHNFHSYIKTLLSESNKQQQDLDDIRDDLGSFKFGFAQQHYTYELTSDSATEKVKLTQLQKKALTHGLMQWKQHLIR